MAKTELQIIFDSKDEMRAYLWILEYYCRRYKCGENDVWLRVQNEIMNAGLPAKSIERPKKRFRKKKDDEDSRFES